jgi:nicotinamidase-related amidase
MTTRLEPASTLLFVVDVQEKLAAAMPAETLARLVHNTRILLDAAKLLGVRVVATEQYPKGLGHTLAPIAEKLPSPPIEKLDFSALDEPRVAHALATSSVSSPQAGTPPRPRAVIVTGMESHVCVFQTARDLATRGYATYVVDDAVASRREDNRLAGLALCERAGAIRTVTETIVFDWVRRAEGDTFKAISKLVR